MLILSADDVRRALPMASAIEAMKSAYLAVSTGGATMPPRTALSVGSHNEIALFMPAHIASIGALTVKAATVFPRNVSEGRPVIQGAVQVLDDQTGEIVGLLEGSSLTGIRTAAGGGASVDALARADSTVLAMIGTGIQARTGVEAVCAVREISEIRAYGRNRENLMQFCTDIAGFADRIVASDSPSAAVRDADIVYTATTSATPTFPGADIGPGTHIVGVGSFKPSMIEMDQATIAQATVFVDQTEACWDEAGELIAARSAGILDQVIELGSVLDGTHPGRTSDAEITLFKSVGLAAQDAAAAHQAFVSAQAMGLGTEIDLGA